MQITINDLRRALLNGGDISAFADIYFQALGGIPVPIISRSNSPLMLPSPMVMVEQTNADLAVLLSRDKVATDTIPDAMPEIKFFTSSNSDGPAYPGLINVIDESRPGVIALECSPCELSAHILYAFSMFCAVGLSAQFDVFGNLSANAHFSRLFHPGSTAETAVLASWLRHIPMIPVGRPDGTNCMEDPAEALYVASRLADIASYTNVLGKRFRLLAIVNREHLQGIEELNTALKQNAGLYIPPLNDVLYDRAIVVGEPRENPDTGQSFEISESSLAQPRFLSEFNKTIEKLNTESLSPDKAITTITEIVDRLRNHPDVVGGPSVRGTLAFHEILNSFSDIKGNLTRDYIIKAALISLPPRISVKRNRLETDVVSDIVKEVLYGICFLRNSEIRTLPEQQTDSDLTESLNQIPGTQPADRQTLPTQSFATVPRDPDKSVISMNHKGKRLSEIDPGQQYFALKQAVMTLIHELDEQLRTGKINSEEYEQRKNALMTRLKDAVKSQINRSNRELAGTILEMMDAQDKIWDKDISFNRMYIYYHIKGTGEKANLSPFKQDYHALQWIIEDLEKQKILKSGDGNSGFLLTGFALDILLSHLIDSDVLSDVRDNFQGFGKSSTIYPGHDIRRFSSGDTFRDLSIRHTLKEIARKKKSLSDVKYNDLKVFLRERRRSQADIVFCIDTSGSMGFNQRLTYARLVAAGLARAAFRNRNRVGIVAFNDYGQNTVGITAKDHDSILNGIASLTANGNTNIGDGIRSARELLVHNRSHNRKIIVLLTDGQASAISKAAFDRLHSADERDLTEESAYLETRKAVAAGIQLSVVYFTPPNETVEQFIKNVARIGKGRVHQVTGLSDLKTMLRN